MKKGVLEMNYSPLRYPGGKSKLTPLVEKLMQSAGINNGVYIEPFVGGGGVALSLLINKKVRKIVINDYDVAIYSVWYAILNETDEFLKMIDNAILTVDDKSKIWAAIVTSKAVVGSSAIKISGLFAIAIAIITLCL